MIRIINELSTVSLKRDQISIRNALAKINAKPERGMNLRSFITDIIIDPESIRK